MSFPRSPTTMNRDLCPTFTPLSISVRTRASIFLRGIVGGFWPVCDDKWCWPAPPWPTDKWCCTHGRHPDFAAPEMVSVVPHPLQ